MVLYIKITCHTQEKFTLTVTSPTPKPLVFFFIVSPRSQRLIAFNFIFKDTKRRFRFPLTVLTLKSLHPQKQQTSTVQQSTDLMSGRCAGVKFYWQHSIPGTRRTRAVTEFQLCAELRTLVFGDKSYKLFVTLPRIMRNLG
jgi:hypothetical protein